MPEPVVRQILHLTWPVLVAQLAHISMAVTDTMLVGHFRTDDLAGLAIASGVHITTSLTLVGILQALSPTVAHLYGAGRLQDIGGAVRQGVWLALLLGAAGFLLLRFPRPLVAWSAPNQAVEEIAVGYLQTTAWAVPAQMLYRTFYALCAAVGRPRPIMLVSMLGAAIHVPLSYVLVYGKLGLPSLGAIGSGLSLVFVAWLWFSASIVYLAVNPFFRRLALFSRWEPPQRRALGELLRIGAPMGFSNLVEISAFTLIALFVAPLGADVAAGHRIAINIVSTCYMISLALGYSLSVLVGQAAGARDFARARATAAQGVALTASVAAAVAALLATFWSPLVGAYTNAPGVRAVALSLVVYAVVMHFFDATQTAASFCLRGYKVTFAPMLVHVAAFWGIGLAGGHWLAFDATPPMGVAGFWLSCVASLIAASAAVGGLLKMVSRNAP